MKTFIFLLLFGTSIVYGAKIISVLGVDYKSHLVVMNTIVKLLSNDHDVTYYLPEKMKFNNTNITMKTVISPKRFENFSIGTILENACTYDTFYLYYKYVLEANPEFYEQVFAEDDIIDLINSEDKYDLLLLSGYGSDHFAQLAHKFNIPIIQVLPSVSLPWHNEQIDNSISWTSDFSFIANEVPGSFWNRLDKFVKHILIWYRFHNLYTQVINQVTQKYFSPGTPRIQKVLDRTDLIFVNTHPVMGYVKPNVKTFVEIGGAHCTPANPLPHDFEEFVQTSGDNGFIYFSLGTVVQGFVLPAYIKSAILNTFARLPQKILWKWTDEMENVPSNVKIVKWAPQQDLLGHKKIKLFITQGGMLSMQEAVYHGVPVLAIPVIFDQHLNSYVGQAKGYARTLNFCDFSEESFYSTIKELIQNTKYKETAKNLSAAYQYQLKHIGTEIKWWVDFVIKHKGTSALRPLTNHRAWDTGVPYDIVIFLVTVCTLLLMLVLSLMYCIIAIFRWQFKVTKIKNQ